MSALLETITTAHDADLVHRARGGDRDAFGVLVVRYQDVIHSLCMRWLGDHSQADEMAQEAFLSAWRALPNFRGEARFDTWLRHIAVNKCRNHRLHRRRRAYDRHDALDSPAHEERPPLQLVSHDRGADARAERSAARDVLQRALDALEPWQREVIVLRDLQDMDYEEIGEILEIARGTVKSRLHRARTALADALDGIVGPEDVL